MQKHVINFAWPYIALNTFFLFTSYCNFFFCSLLVVHKHKKVTAARVEKLTLGVNIRYLS